MIIIHLIIEQQTISCKTSAKLRLVHHKNMNSITITSLIAILALIVLVNQSEQRPFDEKSINEEFGNNGHSGNVDIMEKSNPADRQQTDDSKNVNTDGISDENSADSLVTSEQNIEKESKIPMAILNRVQRHSHHHHPAPAIIPFPIMPPPQQSQSNDWLKMLLLFMLLPHRA